MSKATTIPHVSAPVDHEHSKATTIPHVSAPVDHEHLEATIFEQIFEESTECDQAKILRLEQGQLAYMFREARKRANFLLARHGKAEIGTGMVDHTLVDGREERLGQSAFDSAGTRLEQDNWAEFFYLDLYMQLDALQDPRSAPALPSSPTLSERSVGSEHSVRSWISAGGSYHGILGPMELGKADRSNVDNAQ